jgi:hypothetical protein
MALKKPLNSFAGRRVVGHDSKKKQEEKRIAALQQWAKGKDGAELPKSKA